MSYGEGSIREKTRPDGKSYNPKRWQICVSYTVEQLVPSLKVLNYMQLLFLLL